MITPIDNILNDNPDEALRTVYAENFQWLTGYIRQNSGSPQDAQDIFQEGLSAAWLNLKEGKFEGNKEQFNAYVRQICKYKWINHLRSTGRTKIKSIGDLTGFEESAGTFEELDTQMAQGQKLRKAFADLGEKCQELLGRFYFRKQSLAKIAFSLNNTEESIKTIKYRCMMRLRKIYLEKYNTDER